MAYLEDMCFEDVMAQLDRLLPVELLLTREPEGQQSVSAPGEGRDGQPFNAWE